MFDQDREDEYLDNYGINGEKCGVKKDPIVM